MFKSDMTAEQKIKFEGILDTLNKAETTRYTTYAEYKESYIHDVQFLLKYIEELEAEQDILQNTVWW